MWNMREKIQIVSFAKTWEYMLKSVPAKKEAFRSENNWRIGRTAKKEKRETERGQKVREERGSAEVEEPKWNIKKFD